MRRASLLGYSIGFDVLVVGVEDDPEQPDLTRVYIGSRGRNEYVLLDGENATAVRNAWGDISRHVIMPKPPAEAIHRDVTSRVEAPR